MKTFLIIKLLITTATKTTSELSSSSTTTTTITAAATAKITEMEIASAASEASVQLKTNEKQSDLVTPNKKTKTVPKKRLAASKTTKKTASISPMFPLNVSGQEVTPREACRKKLFTTDSEKNTNEMSPKTPNPKEKCRRKLTYSSEKVTIKPKQRAYCSLVTPDPVLRRSKRLATPGNS